MNDAPDLIRPVGKSLRPTGLMSPDEKIIIQQTPINLRTVIYQDFKAWAKKIYKVVAVIVIGIVVYYFTGIWGIAAFCGMLPVAWILIPKIAEKFMSYISLATIDLREKEPDRISVIQVPWQRFSNALLLDDIGEKAGLASPFDSALGPTWIVDSIRLNEPIPGMPPDITVDKIIIHDIHRNIDFANKYVPTFLKIRKDWLVVYKENFALRSLVKLDVMREYVRKTELFFELADKVIFEGTDSAKTVEEMDNIKREIADLNAKLGISTKSPFTQMGERPTTELPEGVEDASDTQLSR
jgi:hypothetical protein